MKNGAKDSRKGHFVFSRFFAVAILVIAALPACGKPDGSSTGGAAGTGGEGVQSSMKGVAAFGTQCSSGFSTDPKAVRLELWSCPLEIATVELAEPIQPLYFSADCTRKTLTIRSYDRTIDDTWELYPDGSFRITQEKLIAKLKEDGSGRGACGTPLSMDLWGKVECSGARNDQAKIRFETVMWLNKGVTPSSSQAGQQCSLPQGTCYFHALANLSQCT
jgi:hypothetical protein